MDLKRDNNNAWIVNKHINDVNLLIVYAKLLKNNNSIEDEKVTEFTELLKQKGLYNPRWDKSGVNIGTAQNKINELCFYMFGYKHEKKFIFSPLGNLYLEQENESTNLKYIFATMLWSMQYAHPHNNTQEQFKLYPLRLVFRLLLDNRLDRKLYTTEILYYLYFVEDIDNETYEQLVFEILKFRKLKNTEQLSIMMNEGVGTLSNIEKFGYEKATETWWANKLHEWDYYIRKVIEQTGVIQNEVGDEICKLQQGKTNTYRALNNNFISLTNDLLPYIEELNENYPFTDKPVSKDNLFNSEFKAEVYSFLPEVLLNKIGNQTNKYRRIVALNNIIEQKEIEITRNEINDYSIQGEKHKEFEIALQDGFNLFIDIKAERVGGSGRTDVECKYLKNNRMFAVEAKATKNTFGALQSGRLKEHREGINGMYTILILPKYSPSVERDITQENIVILRPTILTEYLYNHLYIYEEIHYEELHNIIINNKGKDISRIISNITLERFSISAA
jgi:hypothetical protein